jgi:LytS/YehU family sensor histidine kinase
VKHGIAKRVQGGAIRIAAVRSNGMLRLDVYNDGPCLSANWENHSGVGMANVRTRLKSLYGAKFDLTMQNRAPDGVEVSLSVPYVLGDSEGNTP